MIDKRTQQTEPADQPAPAETTIIDMSVIDTLFEELGIEQAYALVDISFNEFGQLVEYLDAANQIADWNNCLAAIHSLRGIAVDLGAVVLSDHIKYAKSAVLMRNQHHLAELISQLHFSRRRARSAVLVRLAKFTAKEWCQPTAGHTKH